MDLMNYLKSVTIKVHDGLTCPYGMRIITQYFNEKGGLEEETVNDSNLCYPSRKEAKEGLFSAVGKFVLSTVNEYQDYCWISLIPNSDEVGRMGLYKKSNSIDITKPEQLLKLYIIKKD